jgi:epoxyqueuosine reductase
MMTESMSPAQIDLYAAVEALVRESPDNRLQHLDGSPIFDAPLFGVADGDDPLFTNYKTIIGPYHLTPREVMEYALTDAPDTPHPTTELLRVFTWVLPVSEPTRRSNRRQDAAPSERWAHTRCFGEKFNDAVRAFVVQWLRATGYLALAPMSSPLFKTLMSDVDHAPSSTWSERHALYAAGQGTFSLSDGLITPRGIAHRCGAVVTNLPLAVTPRPYESHTSNCLYLQEGRCGRCIKRCPVGAITVDGHDKLKCAEYVYGALKPYFDAYHVSATGCGLCQTGVPCEAGIPRRKRATERSLQDIPEGKAAATSTAAARRCRESRRR